MGSLYLSRGAGGDDGPSFGEAAVDPFGGGARAHLVYRPLHGLSHRSRRPGAVLSDQPTVGDREQRRAPPAVSTRRAEASQLLLEHRHTDPRGRPQEVIGRPQPGKAGAHDGDVDVGVGLEPSSPPDGARETVPPERQTPWPVLSGRVQACRHGRP